MELYKIRISREGPTMPFSLAYAFRGWDLQVMRKHFETFLGFPIRHFDHDLGSIHIADNEANPSLLDVLPDAKSIEANWHIAVPILTGQVHRGRWRKRKKGKGDPRELYGTEGELKVVDTGPFVMFLTEANWRNWIKRDVGTVEANAPYPDTAYLSTRHGVLSPPCLACPRLLLHESGECEIGDATCFENLRQFKVQGQMRRHLENFKTLLDKEEESVHDADADRSDEDGSPGPSV